jgi:hypothetical protein
MKVYSAVLLLLLLSSCAPRFTVYLPLSAKMNVSTITVVSVDTVSLGDTKHYRIEYVETRNLNRLERRSVMRQQKKIADRVDNISK